MAMAQWLGRRRTSHQQTAGAAQRSCQRPDTGGGSTSHQVIRLNVMERETDLILIVLIGEMAGWCVVGFVGWLVGWLVVGRHV